MAIFIDYQPTGSAPIIKPLLLPANEHTENEKDMGKGIGRVEKPHGAVGTD